MNEENNFDQYEEYKEWLRERQEIITQTYKEIFQLLINVKDFDTCCKELGNILIDMDNFILALNEYKNNLEEYVKPKFEVINGD